MPATERHLLKLPLKMGAVAQCPIEVGPNFLCVLCASAVERSAPAGEAVNVPLSSRALSSETTFVS